MERLIDIVRSFMRIASSLLQSESIESFTGASAASTAASNNTQPRQKSGDQFWERSVEMVAHVRCRRPAAGSSAGSGGCSPSQKTTPRTQCQRTTERATPQIPQRTQETP